VQSARDVKYRRALLLVDPGGRIEPVVSLLRRVAGQLERLLILVPLPVPLFSWSSTEREHTSAHELEALRAQAAGSAPRIDVQLAPELAGEALAALCAAEEIDLLVLGGGSLLSASWLSQRKRPPVAVLWSAAESASGAGPIEHIGCVALSERSRAAIAAFLRDHADATQQVTLFTPTPIAADVLSATLQIAGVEAHVTVASPLDASSLGQWLDEWTRERPIDLLVFTRIPAALTLAALWTAPVLLLPPPPAARPFGERALDVCDLLDMAGPLRVRVDQVSALGTLAAAPDQPIAIVSAGRLLATCQTQDGELELPAGLAAGALGMYRPRADSDGALDHPRADGALDPLTALELQVALLRPSARPLLLFDAELSERALRTLSELAGQAAWEALAIRLRPTRSSRALRERLRALGLAPLVIDARAILDEGEALDVSDALDAVRLARAAARLRRAGTAVEACVVRGPLLPALPDVVAVSGSELARDADALPRALAAPPEPALNADAALDGNRIELEIDNVTARHWLLEAIARSTQSLHLQVYMVLDDDVGRPLEEALAAAAARGVAVRVLVDSLHGLHGSFGARNPLLERLAARPGVELRALRPITELPSLSDLKQRDHRKLVIADGQLALLGGRNLSHEYYTGFDEVPLSADSLWRELPWLDAGARVAGPAVAALSRVFRQAWIEAGGAPFDVVTPAAVGGCAARVIAHRGLRDARTLECYLELIESARSHLYVVNGFPLVLELQHALLRAVARGVRVRVLVGHPAPTHGGLPFGGPWMGARSAATELVHSRLDPIVAAGGEVYRFAQRDRTGWASGLGVVHPHVHAKVLSVDAVRCTVGSANLDITASYWESELLLLVEDAGLTRAFEAQLDGLLAQAVRVQRDDPAWQQSAQRRAWMRHWPGVLSL
jgi:cardiolipin synthase A/B